MHAHTHVRTRTHIYTMHAITQRACAQRERERDRAHNESSTIISAFFTFTLKLTYTQCAHTIPYLKVTMPCRNR